MVGVAFRNQEFNASALWFCELLGWTPNISHQKKPSTFSLSLQSKCHTSLPHAVHPKSGASDCLFWRFFRDISLYLTEHFNLSPDPGAPSTSCSGAPSSLCVCRFQKPFQKRAPARQLCLRASTLYPHMWFLSFRTTIEYMQRQ